MNFRPDILGGSVLGGLIYIVEGAPPEPTPQGGGSGGRTKRKRREELDAEVMRMLQFALQHIDP